VNSPRTYSTPRSDGGSRADCRSSCTTSWKRKRKTRELVPVRGGPFQRLRPYTVINYGDYELVDLTGETDDEDDSEPYVSLASAHERALQYKY
jgi:hypothetical protein